MVTLNLRVAAVDSVRDGVIVVLVQDKMQIPVAEDPLSDDVRVFKKMAKGLKAMGIGIDFTEYPQSPNTSTSFRTGLWVTMEDYEAMGKPTVGDTLSFNIEKLKEELVIPKA